MNIIKISNFIFYYVLVDLREMIKLFLFLFLSYGVLSWYFVYTTSRNLFIVITVLQTKVELINLI